MLAESPSVPAAGGHPHARATGLPPTTTSFVARDDDVDGTVELLGRERLATLIGPGGAGKTRLSIEVGARFVERHADLVRDGAWFVELAPITDGADIPHAVLTALGLRERPILSLSAGAAGPPAPPLDRVVDVLAQQELLLILDNCEHLVDEAAELAGRLLAACPGVRMLTTSREPLGIGGERLLAVSPLRLPPEGTPAEHARDYPSVRLFTQRVAAVVPGFAVDDANVEHVVRICRELDGMPLALELAAARTRVMSLSQLAARLSDRFRLLTSGSRFALPRHQTLQAVVEWSWELLDEAERALLRRLSVFAGGATLEAVERVCADHPDGSVDSGPDHAGERRDVWSVLFALVDKSLVLADPAGEDGAGAAEPRYRMLHTVRAYGAQRLAESGESAAVHSAHAEHVLRAWIDAGPHLGTAEQLGWLRRLRAEHDNFTSALRWAVDSGEVGVALDLNHASQWYWQMVDGWSEATRWSMEILRAAGDHPPRGRPVAYAECVFVAGVSDPDGTGAEAEVLRAEEILRAAGEVPEDHVTLVYLPVYLAMLGHDIGPVIQRLEDSARRQRPWLRASTLMMVAMLAVQSGRARMAQERLDTALAEFRRIGDRWGIAQGLVLSSELVHYSDVRRELELLGEGIDFAEEMGLAGLGASLRSRRAFTNVVQDDLDAAREDLAAVHSARLHPDHRVFPRLVEVEVQRAAGDPHGARSALLSLRADLATTHTVMRGIVEPMWHLAHARVSADMGDRSESRHHAIEAWHTLGMRRDGPRTGAVLERLAEEMEDKEPERAATFLGYAEAVRGLPNNTDTGVARLRWRLLGSLGEAVFDRAYRAGAGVTAGEADAAVDDWVGTRGPRA